MASLPQTLQERSLSRGRFLPPFLLRGSMEAMAAPGAGSAHGVLFSRTLGGDHLLFSLGPLPTCLFLKKERRQSGGEQKREKKKALANA